MLLKNLVFLTKTDTAIGFVSQNSDKLNEIKKRSSDKQFITTFPSLNNIPSRIPVCHRHIVRCAVKTSFITPNQKSFRVSRDKEHNKLLSRLGWAFSTSANLSGHDYDEEFAINCADVIVLPLKTNSSPSSILKLGKSKIKKVR
jgi:tRNA A37 threonylcarbamoyladenosine synthetase subunit TsaC/SUA5/YrdC